MKIVAPSHKNPIGLTGRETGAELDAIAARSEDCRGVGLPVLRGHIDGRSDRCSWCGGAVAAQVVR